MARTTKRDMYVEIAEVLEGIEGTEDLVAFVDHQVELIDKRKSAPRKPTSAQLANEALKAEMVDTIEAHPEGLTATEVGNAHGVTVQKASQLLRQLVADGYVARVEGKGKEKTKFYPAG